MKVGTEEALIILTKKISVWRLGLIMKGKMMASQIVSQPFRKKKAISDSLTILSLGMLKCPQSLQTAACQGQC